MPDRADLHRALDRFYDAGLVPILSLNGGIPSADIEVTRGPRVQGEASGAILEVRITSAGQARLQAVGV